LLILPVFIIDTQSRPDRANAPNILLSRGTLALPKILQGQQLCYLLEQLLIEGGEHLEILDENLHSLGPIMSVKPTANSAQINLDKDQAPRVA
jgi:hypothetical protein